MAKAQAKNITPVGTISFPHVFQKHQFVNANGEKEGKEAYEVDLVLDPEDARSIAKTIDEVYDMLTPAQQKKIGDRKYAAIRKCDEGSESYQDGFPGMRFCKFKSFSHKPEIITKDGIKVTEDDDDLFYAGCQARISYQAYYFSTYKTGITLSLGNICVVGKGERLGGGASAEEDFGITVRDRDDADLKEFAMSSEYDDGDDIPY